MIKLMLFAPCEKLIIGEDNHSSLISVLEHIQVAIPIGEKVPEKSAVPYKWTALTLFHREAEIIAPIKYDLKMELAAPSGEITMTGNLTFIVTNKYINFRNTFEFPVFPMSETGTYKANLYLKKHSEPEWSQVGEYPIRLLQVRKKKNENEDQNQIENQQTTDGLSKVRGNDKKAGRSSKKRTSRK